jgi:hypothetical protein
LQDNGTQFMDQYGLGSWHMSYNGDGSYVSFINGTHEIIGSAQQGRIAHVEIDSIGKAIKFARIDPSQLQRGDYDFINPFVLDPNNQSIMYLPAKRRLFRNKNIFSKAMVSTFDSTRWDTPLWEEFVNCVPLIGQEFSAISISKVSTNTLYYATDKGRLYKVYNADIGQPAPMEITGSNFSVGNINCIALDPLDSNKITVVFSNYNIISLFHTEDGGANWTDISGNLEEKPNGSGSGPSCRWASVLTLANGNKSWFIGTSVGLFATDTLNGTQTRWIKQSPNGIAANIVGMMDTRQEDYTIAVATHGNGVYSANIAAPWQITSVQTSNYPQFEFKAYPNPITEGRVSIVSNQYFSTETKYSLIDFTGKAYELKCKQNKHNSNKVDIFLPQLSSGLYILEVLNNGVKHQELLKIIGL